MSNVSEDKPRQLFDGCRGVWRDHDTFHCDCGSGRMAHCLMYGPARPITPLSSTAAIDRNAIIEECAAAVGNVLPYSQFANGRSPRGGHGFKVEAMNSIRALKSALPESAPNAADDMEALRRKLETTDASQVSAEITRSASAPLEELTVMEKRLLGENKELRRQLAATEAQLHSARSEYGH